MSLLAVPPDQRQEGAHPVHRAEDIDAHQPIPLLARDLVRRTALQRHAGIVDADMDAAELVRDLPRGALDRIAVRNVERQGQRAHAQRGDLAGRALDPVALDVGQRDMDALPGECARDAEADAICRTGDEGEFPGQILHRPLPATRRRKF